MAEDTSIRQDATPHYWCFISYRHTDNKTPGRQWATWLHQQIETYDIPADLVGTVNDRGELIPERVFPVFRDEEELPAGAGLASRIRRELDRSRFLLVICSPCAVSSTYVAEEIAYFQKTGKADRVLAAIIDGEPNASRDAGKSECFPLPLRHPVDAGGRLIETENTGFIAADFRTNEGEEGWTTPAVHRQQLQREGKMVRAEIDGKIEAYRQRCDLATLKILAGVLGVPLSILTERDKQHQLDLAKKRARLFRRVAVAMGVLLVAALAGGFLATLQWREAARQKREAEQQTLISKQTTDFLTGMFNRIDPADAKGRDVTVHEVLDSASQMIEKAFPGQPRVEMSIRWTMQDIYSKIGKPQQALAQAEAALRLAQQAHEGSGDSLEVARSLNQKASCLDELGRSAEALPQYQAALAMSQRLYRGECPDVATSLNNVAHCLSNLGRSTEALPQYQAALEMLQRIYKGDHPSVAIFLNGVAACLDNLGRSAEALPQFQAALEMRQRIYKGDHPEVANSLSSVAYCLDKLGRSAEALPQFQAALEMNQRIYKGDHPDVATSFNNVAYCLNNLGRSTEALPQYQAALEMLQRIYHGDHPLVANLLDNVALCLENLGRSAEALPQSQAALKMRQRLYPGDHPQVATSLNNLASCLDELDRSAEALPQYQAALEMCRRIYKGDHPNVANCLNNVASCLNHQGRSAEALPQYQAALEMFQRIYKGDHPYVADSLNNVADCLDNLGRSAEALPQYIASLEIYQRIYKGDHPEVANSLSNQAICLKSLGRTKEAEEMSKQAAAMTARLKATASQSK